MTAECELQHAPALLRQGLHGRQCRARCKPELVQRFPMMTFRPQQLDLIRSHQCANLLWV